MVEIIGFTLNNEKWDILVSQWEDLGKGIFKCHKHNNIFDYEAEDGGPCWQCWNSCQEIL